MTDLPVRTLGRTGLDVTVLGYGAMELRGAGRMRSRDLPPGQAEAALQAVLDGGINWIDTSIDYGESEETIGRAIASRRSEYYLATKCGCVVDPASAPPGTRHVFTRTNIVDGVEQSLRRMRTDYIDLIQFHASPDKQVLDDEGSVEVLLELKQQGKVRFIGSSSTLPNITDHIAMGVFDAFQIPYSLLQPGHYKVISEAAAAGAGTIIRGGVARGEPGEGRGAEEVWALWDRAGLDDLADGMSRTEFMLRYTIAHPDLHTTIVGSANPEHIRSNLAAAAKGPLPDDVCTEARRRVAEAAAAPA